MRLSFLDQSGYPRLIQRWRESPLPLWRQQMSHMDKNLEIRSTRAIPTSEKREDLAVMTAKGKLLSESITPRGTRAREIEAPLVIIGWREWVSMPELGIRRIKAKIDTGARSSSLHAFDISQFTREDQAMVRFVVHPVQRREDMSLHCEARIHDVRSVRSSSGEAKDRVVIQTPVLWMGEKWTVELTLADRTEMGFRMLIGREAVRGRMLVDPGRSYFGGRPPRRKKRQPS